MPGNCLLSFSKLCRPHRSSTSSHEPVSYIRSLLRSFTDHARNPQYIPRPPSRASYLQSRTKLSVYTTCKRLSDNKSMSSKPTSKKQPSIPRPSARYRLAPLLLLDLIGALLLTSTHQHPPHLAHESSPAAPSCAHVFIFSLRACVSWR